MSNRFRTVALALRSHVSDTYNLLAAADAIVALDDTIEVARPVIKSPDGGATYNWDSGRWDFSHGHLVDIAKTDGQILASLDNNKKIEAIKRLRAVAHCGLREAKDAVEDYRVDAAVRDLRGLQALREKLSGV